MIRVQNLYYMLAYAFQTLQAQGYRDMAFEDFENAAELLTTILCKGVSIQLKRGLGREYIHRTEALRSPRQKIEVAESVKTLAVLNKQLVCSYDEFSADAYANRIIKTTMQILLRANISKPRKKELRQLLLFFEDVTPLDRRCINWKLTYDRNNQTYRMLISVCELVMKGLLQTQADGSVRMMDYLDEQTMPKLYEKFILEYYRQEHPELKVYAPQIDWQLDDDFNEMLPTMQSDIVLHSKATNKTLIIDAKYYAHNLQTKAWYGMQTIHSHNLYQIFTYVKNWPVQEGETLAGMLLYAGTDDDVQPSQVYRMSGNRISVITLKLDVNFQLIAEQLEHIALDYLSA